MPNSNKQTKASLREKTLAVAPARLTSRNKTMRAVEIRRRSGNSLETVAFLILMGRITAAMPISSKTLIILLPITLPRRMSVLPLNRDENDTASSGAPVPKATMVSPMRSLLTLKFAAAEDAPSTSQSAPLIRNTNPMTSNNICKNISICLCD